MNRFHYVMSFDSFEAWGKFQDTPNEEYQKFIAKFNEDPPGTLVKTFVVTQAN